MKKEIKYQNECPTCLSKKFKEVIKLNSSNKKKFYLLSSIKYNGFLTNFFLKYKPTVLMCSKCNHFWYKSFPNNEILKKMYNNKLSLTTSNIKIPNSIVKEIYRLKKIFNSSNPSFLDYGAGYGKWSICAQEAGFDVTSFEPSYKRINHFKFRLNTVHSHSAISNKKFDVINLEQVLEHISEPKNFLKNIKKFMHKKSVLRISVPNMDKNNSNIIWKEWPFNGENIHIMSPYEHLHGFNQYSLYTLVNNQGLKRIDSFRLLRYSPLYTLRLLLSKYFRVFRTTLILVELA